MVLGKLSVPGRPTILDYCRARAYCTRSRCGWGLFWTFLLSSILAFLFLPLLGRQPARTEILSQRAFKPKTTNQPTLGVINNSTYKQKYINC